MPASLPQLELALERPALVEAADRRAEEAADVVPAARDRAARQRAGRRRRRAPRAAARRRAGTQNSRIAIVPPGRTTRASSASVAAGIVDVAEQVGEREVVERGVGERDLRRRRLDELDAVAESLPRDGEHVGALVEAR